MNTIRKILLWFYYNFTKKGKNEKYWLNAEKELKESLKQKGKQELQVKQKCVTYADKKFVKGRFSKFFKRKQSKYQIAKVINEKYKDDLKNVNVKIDKNLNFKDV